MRFPLGGLFYYSLRASRGLEVYKWTAAHQKYAKFPSLRNFFAFQISLIAYLWVSFRNTLHYSFSLQCRYFIVQCIWTSEQILSNVYPFSHHLTSRHRLSSQSFTQRHQASPTLTYPHQASPTFIFCLAVKPREVWHRLLGLHGP